MLGLLAALTLAAPEPAERVLAVAFATGPWRFDGPVEVFTGDQIYEYMDGAGELPVACGYQRLAVARLLDAGGRKFTVELFQCGTSAEAFGVYSLRRQPGEAIVRLTHRARHVEGELCGWRGSHAWVVASQAQPAPNRDDLVALARQLETRIPDQGTLPALLARLPVAEIKPDSARFFHGKFALDTLWFRRDNLLGLPLPDDAQPVKVDAVAARYHQPAGQLILVSYPRAELAAQAHARWSDARGEHEAALLADKLLGLVVQTADAAGAATLAERLRATMAKPGEAWTAG